MRKTDGPEKVGPALTSRRKGQPPIQRDRKNSHPKKDRPTPTPRVVGQHIPRRQGQAPHPKKAGPTRTPRRKGQPPHPGRANHQHEKDGRAREWRASNHPEKERRKPEPQEGRANQFREGRANQFREGRAKTPLQQGKANPNLKKEGPTTSMRKTDGQRETTTPRRTSFALFWFVCFSSVFSFLLIFCVFFCFFLFQKMCFG